MDILIKNMEMPKSCFGCPFDNVKYTIEKKYNTNDWHECFVSKRDCTVIAKEGRKAKWCPLIPVPEHGRLVDLDAFLEARKNMATWEEYLIEDIDNYFENPSVVVLERTT